MLNVSKRISICDFSSSVVEKKQKLYAHGERIYAIVINIHRYSICQFFICKTDGIQSFKKIGYLAYDLQLHPCSVISC